MPTYAIGDIHGCLDELQKLLSLIQFHPNTDQLWFVGDLVGRGKKSLETLRFVKQLPNKIVVLGNHDLHLLALPHNPSRHLHTPKLQQILSAPDCDELLYWLRQQKLLHHDGRLGYTMVHAGLPPQWDLKIAQDCAIQVENHLGDDKKYPEFVCNMYGNKPDIWQKDLQGIERLRFTINALTRIRFCNLNGKLDFHCKTKIGEQPPGYMPWFSVPNRNNCNLNIIFGHWAALAGEINQPNIFALDTGCVWGGKLTAMCLETQEKFSVKTLATPIPLD